MNPLPVTSGIAKAAACGGCAWLLTGVLALSGCGGSGHPLTVPVGGTVTYKGEPLKSGTVRFNPADPQTGRPAEGRIGPDGKFTLSTFEPGDGALAGEYGVSITSYVDGTSKLAKDADTPMAISDISAIPAKYSNAKTSGLSETIEAGQPKKELLLDLEE